MNDPEDSWHAGRTSVTLWFYLQWLLPPLTGAAALTAARTTTPSRQSFKPLALAGIPDSLCGQSRRPHHPWRSAFPACRCTMNTPWPSLPAPPAVSRPPASKQQSKRDPNDPLPSDGTTSQKLDARPHWHPQARVRSSSTQMGDHTGARPGVFAYRGGTSQRHRE